MTLTELRSEMDAARLAYDLGCESHQRAGVLRQLRAWANDSRSKYLRALHLEATASDLI